jgi:hypothetical protein
VRSIPEISGRGIGRIPEKRQRKLDYKREWRQKNKRKVYMQKRRARLAGKPNGWSTREKYEDYLRRYREEHREELRAKARAKYYEKHPVRPSCICIQCGGQVQWVGTGRPAKRCGSCREACRPKPRPCKVCGAEVQYGGMGQPSSYCSDHRRGRRDQAA